jgi:hypothetical protein
MRVPPQIYNRLPLLTETVRNEIRTKIGNKLGHPSLTIHYVVLSILLLTASPIKNLLFLFAHTGL